MPNQDVMPNQVNSSHIFWDHSSSGLNGHSLMLKDGVIHFRSHHHDNEEGMDWFRSADIPADVFFEALAKFDETGKRTQIGEGCKGYGHIGAGQKKGWIEIMFLCFGAFVYVDIRRQQLNY